MLNETLNLILINTTTWNKKVWIWVFVPSVPSREPATHGRTGSQDVTPGGYGTGAQDIIHGSQVVAVGTALATSSLPIGAQQGPVMVCCLSTVTVSWDITGWLNLTVEPPCNG